MPTVIARGLVPPGNSPVEIHMLNRRGLLTAIAGIGVLSAGVAHAKGPHKHINGHNALGAKLKQNGKHEVGKAGKETVSAEVNNGKVVNMSAGSLPVKKVKSKKKMAALESSNIKLAASGDIHLAQVDVYYYAYGFDTGLEEVYYWYPAEDVIVTDTWVEYVPA
jgi:hypothetical protein